MILQKIYHDVNISITAYFQKSNIVIITASYLLHLFSGWKTIGKTVRMQRTSVHQGGEKHFFFWKTLRMYWLDDPLGLLVFQTLQSSMGKFRTKSFRNIRWWQGNIIFGQISFKIPGLLPRSRGWRQKAKIRNTSGKHKSLVTYLLRRSIYNEIHQTNY